MVDRYRPTMEEGDRYEKGDWVKFDDYEELESQKDAVDNEVAELQDKVITLEETVSELQEEMRYLQMRLNDE